MVANDTNITLVCGDTNNATEETGVFVANIDDTEIRATTIDDAVAAIEEIIRTKGILAEENHIISNNIELQCAGHENWTVISDKFK